MATADIRRVIKIGGSMAIILPCQWAKQKVQPGQEVVVVANGELRIFPVHDESGQNSDETQNEAKR